MGSSSESLLSLSRHGSSPSLLDLPSLWLCELLPSFLFRELFGHRQRVLLDLRLERVIL